MKAKRYIIIMATVLLVILSSVRIETQTEYNYYLPKIYHRYDKCGVNMGLWSFIAPEETTNLITNPSFEANTAGYAWGANAQGGGFGRVSEASKYGSYSGKAVCAGAGNRYMRFAAFTRGVNDDITISVWARSDSGTSRLVLRLWEAASGGADFVDSAIFLVTTTWQRLTLSVPDATMDAWNAGGVSLDVWVINDADGGLAKTWFLDALQGEAHNHVTTYCDGNQPGCEWLGAAHASTSQRSALSRAGGIVVDFDDLDFDVSGFVGAGKSPITLNVDNYALLPGGELNSQKTNARSFTLTGWVKGTSTSDLHVNRQALIDAVSINQTPENQPVILRYTGASVVKEIEAYYQSGLGGNLTGQFECLEQAFALRFLATNPNFREVGESSDILDTENSPTLRYVTGRLRSTGQWDDLNIGANPTAGGLVNAIVVAPDRSIYVGGNFTGWMGIAGRDYIAQYIPSTDTWQTVGPGGSVNAQVRALAFDANGILYIGGDFLALGGAGGDRVSTWDGTNYVPVAAGGTGPVYSLAVGIDGIIYVGGNFIDWNAIPNADMIVSWTGAAWAALGTGTLVGPVASLAIDNLTGDLYAGGGFASMGGVAGTLRIARWDGTVWDDLDGGLTGGVAPTVETISINESGVLIAGGAFTSAGAAALAVSNIARWNGQVWSNMVSGANNNVDASAFGPDGTLYITGAFTTIGGLSTTDRMAKWNGATWAHLDIEGPGAVSGVAIATGLADPVVLRNFDLWVGISTGAADVAGSITVTNGGTQDAFPVIQISRSGGTTAVLKTLRNEDLGLELLFDYSLLDGEILIIDLSPVSKNIVSSIFGQRLDAVLANSDFGTWRLQPGNNQITCFVDTTGAPTIEGTIVFSDQYWSMD